MTGIIFDVDGTLWDSTDEVAIAWNEALRDLTDLKRTLTGEELAREFGKPLPEILHNVFPELTQEQQDALAPDLFRYENARVAWVQGMMYDKVVETIRTLAEKYEIYIVSNCAFGYIEAFLENSKLGDVVKDFTCPDYTGKYKADNIRIIMERNHLEHAVYVGDTQGDANACMEAKVPMVFAAYGLGSVEGDYVTIQKFEDLLKIDFDQMK